MTPERLYKYQAFSTKSLENLKNATLFCSRPERFNDPFDCAIRINKTQLDDDDFARVFEWYKHELSSSEIARAKYIEGEQPSPQFREEVERSFTLAFDTRMRENLRNRGIACLTARVDQVLMWSHYADGHRGFCLEFDTAFEPFSKALEVRYSADVPTVNPVDELLTGDGGALLDMVLTKSDHWAYEEEWRILHVEPDTAYTYPWKSLTGVYFGPGMLFVHKEIISLVLRDSPTQLYEVQRGEAEFRLHIERVDYTPFHYRDEQAHKP